MVAMTGITSGAFKLLSPLIHSLSTACPQHFHQLLAPWGAT